MIERFLLEIEKEWEPTGFEPIPLKIIGSTALLLLTDYVPGTKDADVLEVRELHEDIWSRLKKIAGKGTPLSNAQHFYIQLVGQAFPFLPSRPHFHPMPDISHKLKYFTVEALDVVDVVVSKLKTFRPGDLDDIRAMVDLGQVDPGHLIERFERAKDRWLSDARVEELPSYIENLHTVQRDYLLVPATPIELPTWLMERLK